MITLQQFQQMIPTNREAAEWHSIAIDMFQKYEINTVNRIAGFMAQTAHESSDFRILEENLNYSAERLLQVFPRYFGKGKADPNQYARNPQRLANYVYMDANRTKSGALGNTQPGDGWRFRGGGIKQLTGRTNYTAFARDIGMTAEQAADYVRTKRGAFESAAWFWKRNNLARYADRDDIDGMSKRVNGGTIGLQDRRNRYQRAKTILAAAPPRPTPAPAPSVPAQPSPPPSNSSGTVYPTVKRGSPHKSLVERIQRALRIHADGVFGIQTDQAVRSWQRINKYRVNGILDNIQIRKLLGE
jgi:putative chitinase